MYVVVDIPNQWSIKTICRRGGGRGENNQNTSNHYFIFILLLWFFFFNIFLLNPIFFQRREKNSLMTWHVELSTTSQVTRQSGKKQRPKGSLIKPHYAIALRDTTNFSLSHHSAYTNCQVICAHRFISIACAIRRRRRRIHFSCTHIMHIICMYTLEG